MLAGVMGVASASLPPAGIVGASTTVWVALAAAGWLVALAALVVWLAGRRIQRLDESPPTMDAAGFLSVIAPEEDAIGGILRWLSGEVEADALAYLELAPGGSERLRIEPRGLEPEYVAALALLSRKAQLGLGENEDTGDAQIVRWLGTGGSKVLMATGVGRDADEPLRFGRYLLEWVRSSRPDGQDRLEDHLMAVPGVAWAEMTGRRVRVLEGEGELSAEGRSTVASLAADRDLEVEWIDVPREFRGMPSATERSSVEPADSASGIADPPVPPPTVDLTQERPAPDAFHFGTAAAEDPRIRLLDVHISENGQAVADVRVTWKDHEIRGRGHGNLSDAGRAFAAAQAVADALRPLLDTDIQVGALYSATTKEQVGVLIAEVTLEGHQLVGAVVRRASEPDWAGARAVLDAVNRRMALVAGRSGRV